MTIGYCSIVGYCCSVAWLSTLKPAAHCSSLFANNDKTTFSRKKLSFAKRNEKRSTHYSSYTPVFANVCRNRKYDEKSSLNLSKTRLLWRTHFAKRSRIQRITLYTLFAFRTNFIRVFLFRHCLRIVCSGLYAGYTLFANYYETQTKPQNQHALQIVCTSWFVTFHKTFFQETWFILFHQVSGLRDKLKGIFRAN